MSLPKNVNIFGTKFKVKIHELNGYLGLCDRENKIIHIEVDQSEYEKWHTLIHEIGHATLGRVGVTQAISADLEEVVVESIATSIMENLSLAIKGSIPPSVPQE